MASPRPSIPQAATVAWRDTVAAFRMLATQAWIAFAISVAVALLQRFIAPEGRAEGTGLLFANFIVACGQAFLLTPYLIAVHRLIILRETAVRYEFAVTTPRFELFFLWSLVLSLFYWIPAFLMNASFSKSEALLLMGSSLLLVVTIAALIVSARLVILFPAITVDAPGATWANAMADTKGHVWRIVLISMLAALPAFTGLIGVLMLGPAVGVFVGAVLDGAMGLLTVTLAIAVASRLYEHLGDRVNRID